MSKHTVKCAALLAPAILLILFLQGCRANKDQNQPAAEKPIPVAPTTAPQAVQAPQPPPAKLPPATLSDVEAAVRRVFGDDVTIVKDLKQPFVVGDFNGDDSQDVAVVVRPVPSKLSEINGELANWTIQDADHFYIPPTGKAVVKPPVIEPAHAAENELLLAVIHGYGPQGWRDPAARQAYLVKHATGIFLGTARSTSVKAWRAMKIPLPTDIIRAQRDRRSGFIFWTGSAYGWHAS